MFIYKFWEFDTYDLEWAYPNLNPKARVESSTGSKGNDEQ